MIQEFNTHFGQGGAGMVAIDVSLLRSKDERWSWAIE